MLSYEQRKSQQLYKYRGGMLNCAWIAGVARKVTPAGGFIQQTNNLNQMIPFSLAEGDSLPSFVQEGSNIKIISRLHCGTNNGEPIVVLKVLAFESPSIYDMPPRAAWERSLREGVPSDSTKPDVFRPDQENEAMGMAGSRVTDTGNMVKVAGFVASYIVEPAGLKKSDGGETRGCLIVHLRQTKDPSEIIPIRCYGHKAVSLARRLEVGVPLKVEGKLRVRLKNVKDGVPDEDGVLPVHSFLYVHASILSVASKDDISEEPAWAKEMVVEHRSKRSKQKSPQADELPSSPGEVEKPQVDDDIMSKMDPATLAMLSGASGSEDPQVQGDGQEGKKPKMKM